MALFQLHLHHETRTLRGLFVWAVDNNMVSSDPTQGIKNKKSKGAKSGGFPVWTDDEIVANCRPHPYAPWVSHSR